MEQEVCGGVCVWTRSVEEVCGGVWSGGARFEAPAYSGSSTGQTCCTASSSSSRLMGTDAGASAVGAAAGTSAVDELPCDASATFLAALAAETSTCFCFSSRCFSSVRRLFSCCRAACHASDECEALLRATSSK